MMNNSMECHTMSRIGGPCYHLKTFECQGQIRSVIGNLKFGNELDPRFSDPVHKHYA